VGTDHLEALARRERAAGLDAAETLEDLDLPAVDLATLLGELTALKAEVRAETREARALRAQLQKQLDTQQAEFDRLRTLAENARAERREAVREARLQSAEGLIEAVERLERILEGLDLPSPRRRFGWFWRRPPEPRVDREGIHIGLKNLYRLLRNFGVERIECSRGQPFDPDLMRAVATESHPDLPDAAVVSEVTAGWTAGGQVFRIADAIVNRHGAVE
jgi:molecular chaperone GrpE